MVFDLLKYVKDRLPSERKLLEVVADGSEVPIHTLLKIESGETKNPRHDTLKALAQYLHEHQPRALRRTAQPEAPRVSP